MSSKTEVAVEPELAELLPAMNVAIPAKAGGGGSVAVITDNELIGIYGEIIDNCRADRKDTDQLLSTFVEMVVNEGDSTTASKEALVNLVKIKTDINDKMAKVAQLMTSLKLKEKFDGPRHVEQNNHIHISDRRSLLERINNLRQQKKKEEQESDE